MTPTTAYKSTTIQRKTLELTSFNKLAQEAVQLRRDAEEAKKSLDYELSFILLDHAAAIEQQLEESLI